MSSIVGILEPDGRPVTEALAERMLDAMSARGSEVREVWTEGGVALAVARYGWETTPTFSGESMVVQRGDLVAVADASIYYRDDLLRKLAAHHAVPTSVTPTELILSAYRVWGAGLARELEGDFAFLLYDGSARRLIAGRDASGVRPLYHARAGSALVAASTIGGVRAHPGAPDGFDLAGVGLEAAGVVFAYDDHTCYRGIDVHAAGSTAVWSASGEVVVDRWWDPPREGEDRPQDRAAEELRAILGDAVEQRVDPSGDTALWLSGGWDSTAVFAMSQVRLGEERRRIRPVSVSYPPGDTGREDEVIQSIMEHWDHDVRWVDSAGVSLIDVTERYARHRDEPYPFMFEPWMRHLARESRQTGARVVMTGHGGNFLFASSLAFLSDLLAAGRLRTLRREWRALRVRKGQRASQFFKWAVQPMLPPRVLSAMERVRGRPLLGIYERPLPPWLDRGFIRAHGLEERARAATPVARGGSRSGHELYWFMTHPFFPRVNASSFEATLAEGVEQRAPLYDPRLIRFAAAGPYHERYSRAGTKRLLRRAMSGLLPDSVLADRFGRRDGTLESYVDRSLRGAIPELRRLLDRPRLAELGVVDPSVLRAAIDAFENGTAQLFQPEQLLSVAHVEAWLRAHDPVGSTQDRHTASAA
jgi:asparagine synthase (glutamine-hydrolysing)